MADTNGQTLADAILLLSKVSDKLADKTINKEKENKKNALEKVTKTKSDDNATSKKTNEQVERLLANMGERKEKKEDTVVEKPKDVIISSFGRQADDELASAFGKGNKEKKEQEKKEGGGDWLTKLLGPGLLILGAIAGFISSLLEGGFGKIFDDFKKGDFKKGFGDLAKKIGDIALKKIGPSMPIIGPLIAFWNAYKAFDSGDLIMGINFILQGLIGLIPGIPVAWKLGMFNAMNLMADLLEPKDKQGNVQQTIPKGSGGSVMAFILKAIGKVFSFGILKKLPIIGSLFNFYDAYEAFKIGGSAGIAKGVISIVSGILNIISLIPGAGLIFTGLSLGLDVLNAFLFSKEDVTNDKGEVVGQKIVVRDWAVKMWEWLKPKLYYIPFVNTIMYGKDMYLAFRDGDWVGGLISLGQMIGTVAGPIGYLVNLGVNVLKDMLLTKETTTDQYGVTTTSTVFSSFAKELKNKFLRWIVNLVPTWFGARAAVAGMLGIDIPEDEMGKAELNYIKQQSTAEGDKNAPTSELERIKDLTNTTKSIKTQDFIQTPDGKIIQPADSDTTIGFKPGGALDNYFSKNFELTSDNNSLLKNLTRMQNDLLQKQIEILQSSNRYLAEMKNNANKPNNVISAPKVTTNNYGGLGSLRTLQGVT